MTSFPFLGVAARQAQVLDETAHRPWPPPDRAVGACADTRETSSSRTGASGSTNSRGCCRPSLPLDTHDGDAWLGIVPFRLDEPAPARPASRAAASRSEQLDIRTYVTLDDRPGCWLFSVDVVEPGARGGSQAHAPSTGLPGAHVGRNGR